MLRIWLRLISTIANPYAGITRVRFKGYNLSLIRHPCVKIYYINCSKSNLFNQAKTPGCSQPRNRSKESAHSNYIVFRFYDFLTIFSFKSPHNKMASCHILKMINK